jgi:hypothetical protein
VRLVAKIQLEEEGRQDGGLPDIAIVVDLPDQEIGDIST